MLHENPYEPPAAERETRSLPSNSPGERYSLSRAVVFVLGTTGGGAAIGLAGGACLGWLLPGYYRGVFSGGEAPDFDPVAVGIGLGASQGAGIGALVGLVLVLGSWWFQSRLPASRS